MKKAIPALIALGLALGGCATSGEAEFGSSVRHMITGQTYDPGAPRDTVGPLDGQKAVKAVDGYRADKKAAKSQTSSAILVPTTTQ